MNKDHTFINPTQPLTPNNDLTLVATTKNYFSPEECKKIIALGRNSGLSKGTVSYKNIKSESRSSQVTNLVPGPETMWFFEKIQAAINYMNKNTYKYNLLGMYEGVQVASYSKGGKYDWHIDIGPDENSCRKLSVSIQLSEEDDYEGGGLEFSNVPGVMEKSIGTLIIFPSFLPHRVQPVKKGERWSLVAWIYGAPFC